jgi:nucleotide-binding universal stress UspA family protein
VTSQTYGMDDHHAESPPILAAVDSSAHGWDVTDAAGRLADRLDARLILMHVARRPGLRRAVEQAAAGRAACADFHESTALLGRYGALCFVPCEHRIAEGDPADEILLAADELGAALIVVGAGRRGLQAALAPDVCRQVLARAKVPVLVVPSGADVAALDRRGPLVCGTDASDAAGEAVEVAGALAAGLDTDIYCVSIAAPHLQAPMVAAAGALGAVERPEELAARRRASRAVAQEAAERVPAVIDTHAVAEIGDPVQRLDALAGELDASLIVVGHGHRPALDRLLRGSISHSLARSACRAVLVVPQVG